MAKPFEERNQTDTARRKLKLLAKSSGIEQQLVSALANFTWDYDPQFGTEAIGWVSNAKLSRAAEKQLHWIAEFLGLSVDFTLLRDQAIEEVIQAHSQQQAKAIWAKFVVAATNKNYACVSEFSSYHYLRGITPSRARSLAWRGKNVAMVELARNLFLKLFRGGTIERHNLAYLWCDLVVPLEYGPEYSGAQARTDILWVEPLLVAIEALPPKSGLNDLLACCKGLVGGDKWFKQEVLQSLAYADVLRVNGLPVTDMFIAQHRNELSPHFYSNEWSYPLRFWATNGGTINRSAIPLFYAEEGSTETGN